MSRRRRAFDLMTVDERLRNIHWMVSLMWITQMIVNIVLLLRVAS